MASRLFLMFYPPPILLTTRPAHSYTRRSPEGNLQYPPLPFSPLLRLLTLRRYLRPQFISGGRLLFTELLLYLSARGAFFTCLRRQSGHPLLTSALFILHIPDQQPLSGVTRVYSAFCILRARRYTMSKSTGNHTRIMRLKLQAVLSWMTHSSFYYAFT